MSDSESELLSSPARKSSRFNDPSSPLQQLDGVPASSKSKQDTGRKDAVTLDAIAALLSPLKQDLEEIKLNTVTRTELASMIDPMKLEMASLTQRMEKMELQTQATNSQRSSMSSESISGALSARIMELERMIKDMKDGTQRDLMVIFGGMKKFGNVDEAEAWIKEKLTAHGIELPTELFMKGTEFQGRIIGKLSAVLCVTVW